MFRKGRHRGMVKEKLQKMKKGLLYRCAEYASRTLRFLEEQLCACMQKTKAEKCIAKKGLLKYDLNRN